MCTAVMHLGYRIVGDMIDGLSEWLDQHRMKSVRELVGRAVPAYKEWGDLDLSYKVVAQIDDKTCIGCQKCVVACQDGAHQCIFTGREDRPRPAHAHATGPAKAPVPFPIGALAGDRVPWIDEPECVGCNLCQLVCPVPGCITMEEAPNGPARDLERPRGPRRGQGPRRHPRLARSVRHRLQGRLRRFLARLLVLSRESLSPPSRPRLVLPCPLLHPGERAGGLPLQCS